MLKIGLQYFAEEAETIPQTEEVAESVTEDVTPQENTTQEEVTETPFKLKIKYNHEEQELDEEKARELAQKGMNYDKVFEEYSTLKNKVTEYDDIPVSDLKATAQALGMTVKDYLEYTKNFADEANIQKIADTYEVDYTVAKAIYETQKPKAQSVEQPEPIQDRLETDIHELYKAYPEVTEDDIKAIMDDYNSGVPMIKAFEAYNLKQENEKTKTRLSELEKQLSTKKVNEENSNAAVGSLTGGGDTVPSDIYSKEEFNALTKEQINSNLDKALKSMSYWSAKKRK